MYLKVGLQRQYHGRRLRAVIRVMGYGFLICVFVKVVRHLSLVAIVSSGVYALEGQKVRVKGLYTLVHVFIMRSYYQYVHRGYMSALMCFYLIGRVNGL